LPLIRNLENFCMTTRYVIRLNLVDIDSLPVIFPKLKKVKCSYNTYDLLEGSPSPNSVSMLSYFIPRAPVLKHIIIEATNTTIPDVHDHLLSDIQLIRKYHQLDLPTLSLNRSLILPTTLPILREITRGTDFKFQSFYVELSDPKYTNSNITPLEEARDIMSRVEWVGSQSHRVTILTVRPWRPHHPLAFQIPPLAVLQEFQFIHKRIYDEEEFPFLPLVHNQFPLLRKLMLDGYE